MVDHLYEVVRRRAAQHPETIALGSQQGVGWRTLTSTRLLTLVDSLANELAAEGVREGDRVILWLPGHWRTPVYLFALWKLGAIAVPFDREMNPAAGATIVESVRPRLVIGGYGEQPAWAPAGQICEWWEPGSHNLAGAGAAWTQPKEALAAIYFTSGTTGSPKGCVITHANLCSQIEALRFTIPLAPGCRLASILPLSHLFELTVGLLYPLSAGAAIHYVPSRRGPDVVRVLHDQRITHMIAVPQLLVSMGAALEEQLSSRLPAPALGALYALAGRLPLPARRRLFFFVHRRIGGCLQMMASGGAALAPETQALWQRLGVRVVQGYGASECSPVIACGAGDGSTPAGSVGRPLRGIKVRLTEGELEVNGPNVMRGYWEDPARTAEVLHDGWYATGDLGRIDEHGDIWLSGRAKDLIVLPSGMNVWPQDIEATLCGDEAVKDAAVVAVPRAGGNVTLHAFLLPAASGSRAVEAAAVAARANAALAPHQRVASASWWPEADFPRTSTLKVKRALLPLPEAIEAAPAAPPPVAGDLVGHALAGLPGLGEIRDGRTLGDLGLDSLSLVDLAVSLEEKSGRAVGDADLRLEMTVAQVREFIAGAPPLAPGSEGDGAAGERSTRADQPAWPYGWGRLFRGLSLPFDLLYRAGVTSTTVVGGEHLRGLRGPLVLAGTHHGFTDVPLVRYGLAHTPARRLSRRLVVATGAGAFAGAGPLARYGVLAFGLYPLRQRSAQEASLRGLASLAMKGNPILIFPQGTHVDPARERAGDPGVQFRNGAAHLATSLDAQVVPFGVAGTELLIPPSADDFKGRKIGGIPLSIHRGPLAIAFGAPLRLEPGETAQAFTGRVQAASYALARAAEEARAKALVR